MYGENFGDQILDFIKRRLQEICLEDQYFINLRSDVFMVVTEYGREEELVAFIEKLDARINSYKDVKLQLSYGVYTVEDKKMELRQMEDRAAMARKAAKGNILTIFCFIKSSLRNHCTIGNLLRKICRLPLRSGSL